MTTIKTLTASDIVAGIQAAIESATDGQETTRDCYYATYDVDGVPTPWGDVPDDIAGTVVGRDRWRREHIVAAHCIVGVVLNNAGVPLSELAEWEDMAFSSVPNLRLEPYGLAVDGEARELLTLAQSAQDAGDTWGEALSIAQNDLAWLKRNDEEEN